MGVVSCRGDKEKITVGEHILLNCTGKDNADFSFEKTAFKSADQQKYNIKIFKAKAVSEGEFSLDFTVYAPGEYNLTDLVLTDGVSEINLSGAAIKVESVIQPRSDGKPPEPYGSLLPIGIAIPVYYYLVLLAVMLFTGIYSAFKIKRLSYYKKLREKLTQYDSPVAPDTQFYRSIRASEKAGYPLDQIEKAFRLYNVRANQLPMFDLPNNRILKYFKRNFPQHKNTRITLAKLLGEFEELQKKNDVLTTADKHEFIKKLYRYVDVNEGRRP